MSQIQQIKEATDIVEIIGERLDLKKAGINYRALCPFHSEKSPSFFVNDQLQRYRCFGCGASGDVLEFLQHYDNMSFAEALKYLADRAGIELADYQSSSEDKLRSELLEILDLAKKYYHFLLVKHRLGEAGREYLKKRGTTQESIKLFQLGFALPAWDGLVKFLTTRKKYRPELLVQAGLAIKSDHGHYYDRFRDRIIFPLRNHRGQVVGFSGRVLHPDDQSPKYINSPETLVYHKSEMLFGFSELNQLIKQKKTIIIAEGEFDVISSFQAHVPYTVAIKGSALSEKQASLISRVAEQVILSLDADSAGMKAMQRAIPIINQTNLDLRVINLPAVTELDPPAKDADELIQRQPALWRALVKKSVSAYDYLIGVALANGDPSTARGKREIIDQLAPTLNQITHQVEKDFYLQKLAAILQVKVDSLATDIAQFGRPEFKKISPELKPATRDPQGEVEKWILSLLLSNPDQILGRVKLLAEFDWQLPAAKILVRELSHWSGTKFELKKFLATLAADIQTEIFDWLSQPNLVDLKTDQDQWPAAWQKFKEQAVKRKIVQLNQQIEQLEANRETGAEVDRQVAILLAEVLTWQNKLKPG